MVRFFGKGIISTDRTLFPTYDGGVYDILPTSQSGDALLKEKDNIINFSAGSRLVVSRGLSRGHIGFRLFNQPELVVVHFK